jgi:hypothetical protein
MKPGPVFRDCFPTGFDGLSYSRVVRGDICLFGHLNRNFVLSSRRRQYIAGYRCSRFFSACVWEPESWRSQQSLCQNQ